jgi:hypothetical protein
MPPDVPQKDEVFSTDRDPIVVRCAGYLDKAIHRLHWRIIKTRTVRNPQWGTIWRADLDTLAPGRPILFRYICTGKATVMRPLEMFDSRASIPPLK